MALLLIGVGAQASSAQINHGDFMGTDVIYTMVMEDSPSGDTLPLYGGPVVAGNSLDFNPIGFAANDSGGGPPDITEGQLSFMVEAIDKNSGAIFNVMVQEFGDTTLTGPGDDATRSIVTSDIFIDIVELNGTSINPVKLQVEQLFAPHDGEFLLDTHGGGASFNTLWMGMVLVDLQSAIIDAGHPIDSRITKLTVNLDNTLSAMSQANASALIAKDRFIITTNIPEPASCSLALIATLLGGCRIRRARR